MLLVIGSIATQIYVIVLMFLVNWNSGASHLVGMNAYYACCTSCLRKRLVGLLELITRRHEAMLSLAFSVGKVLFIAKKEG